MSKQSKRHMGAKIKSAEGVDAITVADDGRVGIGTANPDTKFTVYTGTAGNLAHFTDGINADFYIKTSSLVTTIGPNPASTDMAFQTGGTERMRIDSSGNLLVGTTSAAGQTTLYSQNNWGLAVVRPSGPSQGMIRFFNGVVAVGSIETSTTTTTYVTTSDHRLKEDVKPMSGALSKVAALKPVTYKWRSDSSEGEGFIAHELAEVCPLAVVGEKDAINEDGSTKPQGIDPSKLVGLLTAAIQELKAELDEAKAEIAALKKGV